MEYYFQIIAAFDVPQACSQRSPWTTQLGSMTDFKYKMYLWQLLLASSSSSPFSSSMFSYFRKVYFLFGFSSALAGLMQNKDAKTSEIKTRKKISGMFRIFISCTHKIGLKCCHKLAKICLKSRVKECWSDGREREVEEEGKTVSICS